MNVIGTSFTHYIYDINTAAAAAYFELFQLLSANTRIPGFLVFAFKLNVLQTKWHILPPKNQFAKKNFTYIGFIVRFF